MTRYGGCGVSLAGEIPFVAGDEIVQRFVILAERTIVDVTGWTVTASVWVWGSPRADISATVEIADLLPSAGEAHGAIRLVEAETAKLAKAGPAFLRLTAVDGTGRTMHTAGAGMREIGGPATGVSGAAILNMVLVGVRASDLQPPVVAPSLDFSIPTNSQYLAALYVGPVDEAPEPGSFGLFFNDPANSHHIATIGA